MSWKGESHRHKLARMGINTNPNKQSIDPVASKLFYMDEFDIPQLYDFIGDFPDSRYKTRLEYQQKEKDRTAKIVWITPDEYEEAIHKGFMSFRPSNMSIKERIMDVNIDKLVAIMKKHPVYMPMIRYDIYYNGGIPKLFFGQEGHHRAVASKILGAKQIPVFVIYPYSKESFDIVADKIPNSLKKKLGK
jgi:hypothetical protein